jgi:trehalose 6-phosphate phosphatase
VVDADATVAALTARADRTAILVDFDGSLSAIVDRAEDARPLPGVTDVLSRLAARFGRVAVVSGRPVGFLARHLPVEGLSFVGLYGMEQSTDGVYSVDPRVQPYLVAVAAATKELEARIPNDLVEPKSGISVTLHWRPAPDQEEHILAVVHEVGARHGLRELPTRMAIELRPPIDVDKGAPTRALVDGFDTGAFAGDDYGDLPAFAALAQAVADGVLQRAVRIGVTSSEAPPELAGATDLVVEGPAGLLALLTRVADEIGEPVGR